MIPIIRYCGIFIIFLIPLILIFRRYKKNNLQKKPIIIYLVLLAIVFNIAKLPIENVFLKYDSPEEAFDYVGKGEYLGAEEGEDSYLIILQHKSEQKNIYLSKENSYLKMPFFALSYPNLCNGSPSLLNERLRQLNSCPFGSSPK